MATKLLAGTILAALVLASMIRSEGGGFRPAVPASLPDAASLASGSSSSSQPTP